VQQFMADFDTDLFRKRFDRGGGDVHFAIVLTNRTTLQATREAGLVQIANALIEVRISTELSALHQRSALRRQTRCHDAGAFELSARRPFRSSLGEETGVEDEDSGMLLHAARGKQDRGDSGASMPVTKRGSGLGDRSHGGEIAERRRPRPR
jgi:hypothetical protein